MIASANISIGPITQFCTSDRPSTFGVGEHGAQLLVTHLGEGRIHHEDEPAAIGIFVVPT